LHTPSEPSTSILIRVLDRDEKPVSGESVLAATVYTLIDSRNWKRLEDNVYAARTGRISADELVRSDNKMSYETVKAVQQFYSEVWLPHCKKNGITCDETAWFGGIDSYGGWLASHRQLERESALRSICLDQPLGRDAQTPTNDWLNPLNSSKFSVLRAALNNRQ
jgi:hypothetical protein